MKKSKSNDENLQDVMASIDNETSENDTPLSDESQKELPELKDLTSFISVETLQQQKQVPLRADFFRMSENKALVLKLWPARMLEGRRRGFLPSMVEIEEVTINSDGSRIYGSRIRLPTTYNSMMMAMYLEDFLLDARELERQLREELNREGIEWTELDSDE